MNPDWLFSVGDLCFDFRSTGVLIQNGKILIQRGVDDVDYALPGGHVAWGETSSEALVREFKEELGIDITVERLIWVEEVFWSMNQRKMHTICHYHLVTLADSSRLPDEGIFPSLESDVSRLLFQWVDLARLDAYSIYPRFLHEQVIHISDGIDHFISRES